MDWANLSIWIQVALTLIILSFLYRDNPLYKLAEHLFVGLGTGYFIIQQYHGTFIPNLAQPFWRALFDRDLTQTRGEYLWDLALIVPLAFGTMFFMKFASRTAWIARWPMAVVIGTFAGLAIIGFAQGDLVPQIQANLIPFFKPGTWQAMTQDFHPFNNIGPFFQWIWNPILIVGVLSSLVYFFFSKPHTGVTGGVATLGIWFLMMSFGASYGATVMTRISLFLERANFMVILNPRPTVVLFIVVVALLVFWRLMFAERNSSES